jgi:phage anti-repressor protein/transcriptional regulator with XRE-family HTH domain
MNYQKLALAISAEIKRRKMIMVFTVKNAGLGESTLQAWCRGKSKPTQDESVEGLLRLIKCLKVDIKQFSDLETFHGRLTYSRLSNQLTVSKLAEKSSLSTASISNFENNGHKPNSVSIFKLAQALNVKADWLLNGESKPVRNGLVDLPPIVEAEIVESETDKRFREAFGTHEELRVWHEENEGKKPLVPIVISKIGDNEVNSVSARDLYLDLGMDGSNWAKWSRINVVENEFFKAGFDFVLLVPSTSEVSRGNHANDYAVTIEFAKHIAMMAKTQRAHDYRNYFIECEKKVINKQIEQPRLSISELNHEFKNARELASNRGYMNGEVNDAAAKILKEFAGVDLDAIIGKPKHRFDVQKMAQGRLVD